MPFSSPRVVGAALAALGLLWNPPAGAAETVFLSDFSTTTVNPAVLGNPTTTSMEWVVGATKDHGAGGVGEDGFGLDLGSTSAAFVEAAGRFTRYPVELTEAGDFIRVFLSFTAEAGILQGASNSALAVALLDSGGVNPPAGVDGRMRFDQALYTSGGMQDWSGYTAGFENAGGANRFYGRPAQPVGSNSAAQELLFPGNTGAFVGGLDLLTTAGSGVTLADGTRCTIIYTATLTAPGTLDFLVELYADDGGPGTRLTAVEGRAMGASLLTTRFDALGMGYIRKSVSGNSRLTYTRLEIETNKPNLPPQIESGPTNLTLTTGGSGALSVTARGTAPMTYTWYQDGIIIAGETGPTLAFPVAEASIEGTYHVVVSNVFGTDTSPPAVVVVTDSLVAPSIQTEPVGTTLVAGEDYTFTVLANGSSPLQYDWKKDGISLGAPDQDSLPLTAVTVADAGAYTVEVTNSVGSATSLAAVLEVWSVPTITASPVSVLAEAGTEVVLSVSAEGVPTPTFRWFRNGSQIAGESGASLVLDGVSGADAGAYHAEAENGAGAAASAVAFVNVLSEVAMTAALPVSGNAGLPIDQPLDLTFDAPVAAGFSGKIQVRDSSGTLVDTIDFSAAAQIKDVGGVPYHYDPVLVDGNTVTIVLHTGVLMYGKTYYMTIEPGALLDADGATFAGVSDTTTIRFTTRGLAPAPGVTRLQVASDGQGDFATVQGAIDHVPAGNNRRVIIQVEEGTYRELLHLPASKPLVTLQGASRDRVVISYLNNANRNASNQRASFWTRADDLVLASLTFVNTTPKGGSQAETLNSSGNRITVRDCRFVSFQDTLKLSDGGAYFYDCSIEGDVDFMWDDAAVFFDRCTIHSVNKGYLVQARNGMGRRGFVFVGCTLTGEADAAGTYLARIDPGRFRYSEVAFINCAMGAHIAARGWLLDNASTAPNIRFLEFGTTDLAGIPLDLSGRLADATMLDPAAAAQYLDARWVTGYDPYPLAWRAGMRALNLHGWAWESSLGWVWRPTVLTGEAGPWIYSHRLASWIYLHHPKSPDQLFFYAHRSGIAGWYWNDRKIGPWVYRFSAGTWHRVTETGIE